MVRCVSSAKRIKTSLDMKASKALVRRIRQDLISKTSDAEKAGSFPTPPRRANRGRPPVMTDTEINKLATKVAYMSQELEFLKKIILAEKKEK